MKKGDLIKLIKPMGVLTNIGEVYEIQNVNENNDIEFRFDGRNLCYMSYDEFEKYFELVKQEEQTKDNNEFGLFELFLWCRENDKPFYPHMYNSIIEKINKSNRNASVLNMYTNRLCLAQYRNKSFKDSDFSNLHLI